MIPIDELSERCRDLQPDQILPYNKRVWMEIIPPAQITASGLHIPKTAQEQTNYGVIRAKSCDVDIGIEVGDVIMVEAWSGQTIEFKDRAFMLLDQDQIRAVLDMPGVKS